MDDHTEGRRASGAFTPPPVLCTSGSTHGSVGSWHTNQPRHQIHRDTRETTTVKKKNAPAAAGAYVRVFLTTSASASELSACQFFPLFLGRGRGRRDPPTPNSPHFSPTWKKKEGKKSFTPYRQRSSSVPD